MERVHRIQRHRRYQALMESIRQAEQDRPFCRHSIQHTLDVARLMYIYSLEDGSRLPKELLYATALLHDIGRFDQLTEGVPHEEAGARIAGEILADCGFTAEEIQWVQRAILGHRDGQSGQSYDRLTAYLYRADKRSRSCFDCPARETCNWPEEKKNLLLDE